jgi:hypothetical protein
MIDAEEEKHGIKLSTSQAPLPPQETYTHPQNLIKT